MACVGRQQPARDRSVRAIHLSPDAPEVDVEYEVIEVQKIVDGLAYKDASSYTEVSTGTSKVVLKRSSDGAMLGTYEDFIFAGDIDHTVYAVNFASNIEFIDSKDDRSEDVDNALVRFVRASPDAPKVDIKTNTPDGSVVFSGAASKILPTILPSPRATIFLWLPHPMIPKMQ